MKAGYRFDLIWCACMAVACSGNAVSNTSSVGGGSGGSPSSSGASGTHNDPSGGASAETVVAGSGGASVVAGSAGATVAGAGGGAGVAGEASAAGAAGGPTGCNKPLAPGVPGGFVTREVHVASVDPVYLTGMYKQVSGPYDFSFRPYSVRLPSGYDPKLKYAVTFGATGCGNSADNFAMSPQGGMQISGGKTIQVGLINITGCFADGGPTIGNRTDTPEEPYFRAVLKDLEQNYCVDDTQVFLSGSANGAFEAYTLGCAAADLIRGISTVQGGMRNARPPCTGPMAAVLVASTLDPFNPIGPLDPSTPADADKIALLGSNGSAPARDDLLKRNGCVGTATVPLQGPYNACLAYTGCPAAYPVVWCTFPSEIRSISFYQGINYSPGPMWEILSALPPRP